MVIGIPESEIIVKLFLSFVLGALVGLERDMHGKPAGTRTHILVAVGSTIFAILSGSFSNDPSRIAASVVTGIGFLGAGMIFQAKDKIRGLTTAAELWALAAIGLSAGFGYYFIAIAGTFFVLFVLWPGKVFEKKLKIHNSRKK